MTSYETAMRAFHEWFRGHRVGVVTYALMCMLIDMAHRAENPAFPVPNEQLMEDLQCDWNALRRARKALSDAGFIAIEPGRGYTPPTYALTNALNNKTTTKPNKKPKRESTSLPLSPLLPPLTIPPYSPPHPLLSAERNIETYEDRGAGERGGHKSSEALMQIPMIGDGMYVVDQPLVDELSELFPAVDVLSEIRKAKAWILANPKNRKKNVRHFLTNWLSRAQDKARRDTVQPSLPTGPRPRFFTGSDDD